MGKLSEDIARHISPQEEDADPCPRQVIDHAELLRWMRTAAQLEAEVERLRADAVADRTALAALVEKWRNKRTLTDASLLGSSRRAGADDARSKCADELMATLRGETGNDDTGKDNSR